MTQYPLGQIVIQRIVESICTAFDPLSFFPETTPDDWARHRTWMEPRALDPVSGNLVLPIQAFLVRTRRHVDYVMCTHLHSDHVGWNTQLRDGRWVPTFPNAKYIFARSEWEGFEALHRKHPQPQFLDSVLPIMEARQAELVSGDFALDDEVWLEPTPGHTPGHVCVHLASQGSEAVITGDCIHSPVQCVEPEWIMRADFDPTLARTTRRSFLERYCDSSVMVYATHFPEPSTGRIIQRDKAFWFEYERIEG